MTKEIKEILDIAEKCNYIDESGDSCEELLDYITNLQKENELRQQDINNLTYQLAKEKEIKRKAIEFVKSMEYCGQEDYFYDYMANDPCGNDNTFDDSKEKLLNILQNGSDSQC